MMRAVSTYQLINGQRIYTIKKSTTDYACQTLVTIYITKLQKGASSATPVVEDAPSILPTFADRLATVYRLTDSFLTVVPCWLLMTTI